MIPYQTQTITYEDTMAWNSSRTRVSLKPVCEYLLCQTLFFMGTEFELKYQWAHSTIFAKITIIKQRLIEGSSLELSEEEIADLSRISGVEGQVLSEIQAQSILTMPLQRLTGLEREKIDTEFGDLEKAITDYKG